MSDTTNAPVLTLAHVKRVGTDDGFKETRALDVVMATDESYDWSARGAVSAAILAAMGLSEHPEAQKRGPSGEQKETVYGKGHRKLADAVRAIVKGDKPAEPGVLRFALSGEGGETITVKPGDEHYATARALFSFVSEHGYGGLSRAMDAADTDA